MHNSHLPLLTALSEDAAQGLVRLVLKEVREKLRLSSSTFTVIEENLTHHILVSHYRLDDNNNNNGESPRRIQVYVSTA